jgi:uncharacterized protein YjbJ (UPF0337 family)
MTHDVYTDTEDWSSRIADEGRWQQARGAIRQMWGELTDQELEEARGSWDRLVGAIKEKTGESSGAVEERLKEIFA